MAFMVSNASADADNAQINITPLVDVMLVLLIIFLVAAPVVVKQIDLPLLPSPPPVLPDEPTVLKLQIDSQGELVLDGSRLSATALDRVFSIEASRPQPPILQLEVAPEAPYAQMTEVLAMAKNHDLNRLELGTH